MWLTVPGTPLLIGLLYALVPPPGGVDALADRLALTMRWVFVAMLPYAAVCLTILARRFFEGAHNPLAGGESETLQVHCRVMANTLEQFVWLAVCLFALATLLRARTDAAGPDRVRVLRRRALARTGGATCAPARLAGRPACS